MTDVAQHIDRAVKAAGSQAKLAQLVGCSQQYVSLLMRGADVRISAEKAIAFERAGVSRHVLRPDLFGPPPEAEAAQ